MSDVDLVITDVDGTLVLPEKHNPTTAVRKALVDVQDAGIALAAATSRPYEMTRDLFLDIGLKGECIFDNGATIRDVQTGNIIWKNWLEVSRLKLIMEIILPHAVTIDFFPIWKEIDAQIVSLNDVEEPAPYVFSVIKSDARNDIERRLMLMQNVNVFAYDYLKPTGTSGIQVSDINSDKYYAANKLRELFHNTKNKTLAIGDGSNDLALFKAADIKVAMGNAVDELKAAADFVVASVEEDGFAEAMQKFVLN